MLTKTNVTLVQRIVISLRQGSVTFARHIDVTTLTNIRHTISFLRLWCVKTVLREKKQKWGLKVMSPFFLHSTLSLLSCDFVCLKMMLNKIWNCCCNFFWRKQNKTKKVKIVYFSRILCFVGNCKFFKFVFKKILKDYLG